MSVMVPLARAVVRGVSALPPAVQAVLAGPLDRVDGASVHPDVGLALRMLNADPRPTFERVPVEEGRAQLDQQTEVFSARISVPRVSDQLVETEHGDLRVRRYDPWRDRAAPGLVVYYHGGGFALGNLDSVDSVCRFIAREAGLSVLSVDYRLAPEHPWPAAPEDALAAYRYAVAQAPRLGIDPSCVLTCGDSAGGNLALVTAMMVRDRRRAGEDGLPPVRMTVPFYPVVDFVGTTRSRELFPDRYLLTRAQIDWCTERYLPRAEDRGHPYASVLRADDLSDLGRLYVAVAGFDPLRDEGVALVERLREAGNDVTLDLERHQIHAFANGVGVSRTSSAAVRKACRVMGAAAREKA